MEKSISNILATIDDAVNKFQDAIPGIQKLIYSELLPIIKEIDIRDGKLLNNVNNLKRIGNLKNKLEKLIISANYKKSVGTFIESFAAISNLQADYFKQFNQKFKPKNTLPIIKQLAIESTINNLVGQGMASTLIDPIQNIFTQNITTGGSYSDFQSQIRDHILKNENGPGTMERYTKQITTDAIHQYNAQYSEAIAQDLQFNWGRYVGSNIETSREFCILLTEKQWVHKSELPKIVEGYIDGTTCKLSKTTGLPLGMIPGTSPDNFKIRRGGYNCGHQFFWVPDSAVPADIKSKFETKAVVVEDPAKVVTKKDEIILANAVPIEKVKSDKITVYEDLFDSLPNGLTIEKTNKREAYYMPGANKLVIGNFNGDSTRSGVVYDARNSSEYFRDTVMAHETGHAIHSQKGIINTPTSTSTASVSAEFAAHFKNLKSLIKGKESTIQSDLMRGYSSRPGNEKEQIVVLFDILGSLTKGRYGWGHSVAYYKAAAFSEAEIFAHSVSLTKAKNEFVTLNDDMNEVVKEMIDKISQWL